jgi:hypothetical protein
MQTAREQARSASWGLFRGVAAAMVTLALFTACGGSTNNPNIKLSGDTLLLTAKAGQTISDQLSIENTGSASLNYSISVPVADSWLGISPSTGTLAVGAKQTIAASAACPQTAADLSSTVTIAATGNASLSKTFTVKLKCEALDTTPDDFKFTNVINAEPDSLITAAASVNITGIDPATPVSATGGAVVLVNGVAASTIKNNDQLSIQLKSSKLFETAVSTTVTVGTVARDFSITTKKESSLSLSLEPTTLSLAKGGSKAITINLVRQNLDAGVSVSAANLPAGVSVNALTIPTNTNTGQLTMTASPDAAITGPIDVLITATGAGKSASQTLKLSIVAPTTDPLKITGYSSIEGVVGQAIMAQTPTVTGGTKPYSITIAPALPSGLAINATTGQISGSATAKYAQTSHVVTVTDADNQTATTTLVVTINPAFGIVKNYGPVQGTIGYPIKFPGQASIEGGKPPYSYSISPTTLPNGVNLNALTGVISGTPTVLYALADHVVTVKDQDGAQLALPVKITVNPVPKFTKGYQSLINQQNHGDNLPQTPETSSGTLPLVFSAPNLTQNTGIAFDNQNGTISGLPSKVASEETYTVTVLDLNDAPATTAFRVQVTPEMAPAVVGSLPDLQSKVVDPRLRQIKISFNEAVDATADGISLECGITTIPLLGLPSINSSVLLLSWLQDLPEGNNCSLNIKKEAIKDSDSADGPDNLEADYSLSFKTAGFSLSKTTASVNESGTTDSFTVVLTSQPSSDVVLSVVASDTTEASVSPIVLTFTTNNWNIAQTATVTGLSDGITDGDIVSSVVVSIDNANSDGVFDALANKIVVVTTVDNVAPIITGQNAASTLEDTARTIVFADLLVTDPDNTYPTGFTLTVGSGSNYTHVGNVITPALNFNGPLTVPVTVSDGTNTSVSFNLAVAVTPVNDVPSFTKGADQTVLEDAGAQIVTPWATALNDGDPELTQTLTFAVSNDNNALFSTQPSVSATGTLTYTPAANANGGATVTITLSDDGGTANGGVDTSASQTFTITVTAVNDVPSFTKGADQTVLEDAGVQTVTPWATAIDDGDPGATQTLNFTVANNNNALFSTQPAVSATGTLTYTPAANANGSATVTVTLSDDGGVANGGVDGSVLQTFTIIVTAVNDAPSFTKGADQTVLEDAGPQTVTPWATAIDDGDPELTQILTFNVSNNNNALFSTQPSVSPTGTLTYTPATNANGSATVTVILSDNSGTANGGVDTSASQTFTITVTAVNDAPVNTVPGAQIVPAGTSHTFNNANSNLISTSDIDAGNNPVVMTLSVPATKGTLTLASISGLLPLVGNGSNSISATGTLADMNAALNGLVYAAPNGLSEVVVLTLVVNDQGFSGGGALSDTDSINISVDTAPTVLASSTPSQGATVPTTQTITLDFSETVNVVPANITLNCGGVVSFTTGITSNVTSITLTPTVALTAGTSCVLTVPVNAASDSDSIDPPDQLGAVFSRTFTVGTPPTITSGNAATFIVGNASNFTFTATGAPTPTFALSCIPALPGSLSLNSTSGLLSGTPLVGDVNTYACTLTASNGVGSNATQNFTLTIRGTLTQTFAFTGTIQTFTVPMGVTNISIDARGAQGGSVTVNCAASGGLGARMVGDFTVVPGDVISVLVGGQGQSNGADAGGGGGSFVVAAGNAALVVAGGGGGATNNIGSCGSNRNGINATITTSGTASANGLVAGGMAGNGGGASSGSGGGGGGFLTNGVAGTGLANNNGKSFLNGGIGGTGNNNDSGGFGGGGAGWFTGGNGGGGGGYSGGGTSGGQPFTGGGGGGSFNGGSNQSNTAGFNMGNGSVIISF